MSASYTKTVTDLKKLMLKKKKKRHTLICSCKNKNTFVYVSIHIVNFTRSVSNTCRITHTHLFILQHSYCLNVVNSHDDTQKMLWERKDTRLGASHAVVAKVK